MGYYGTGQRVGFAGLVIGFLMCITGCIAPYWQQGNVNINMLAKLFDMEVPVIGETDLVRMNGGLWWCCWDALGEKECKLYFDDDPQIMEWITRGACVLNVALTLVCALAALCRTCCCTGGKTICHGIMAFLAGGAGIAAIGLFAAQSSEGFAMRVNLVQFGWAFYVYCVGTGIVFIISFMLCFASPENPLTPVIIHSVGNVLPYGKYSRMADDRLPLEETVNDVHVNASYPQVQSY